MLNLDTTLIIYGEVYSLLLAKLKNGVYEEWKMETELGYGQVDGNLTYHV